MKKILVLVFIFMINQISAQKAELIITNLETKQEKFIKENRRIKIKILAGEKLVGRMRIVDENTIMLRGVEISLGEIERIKKHPLIGSIGHAVGVTALGIGSIILGSLISNPPIGEGSSQVPQVAGIIVGIGALVAATRPINIFDKNYKVNRKWKFTIKMSP